ncbi:transcriptional regulator [Auritidibacter ignavus]|nr:transcriptional regulator [Auritidibacter ignavus]WGH92000.1 transcriptional regulator [Auritidibacter ignavus]WHS29363.1 transcriptional regulator [Auritidibacter ignavus]WHS36146.1 transcriptional regulator [Auritidibacter ignavus]
MAALASIGPGDRISYSRLQEVLEVTSGNLTSHLRKLEEAGYIHQEKRFVKRSPVTEVRLSKRGLREFDSYIEQLRGFLDGVDECRTQTSGHPHDARTR